MQVKCAVSAGHKKPRIRRHASYDYPANPGAERTARVIHILLPLVGPGSSSSIPLTSPSRLGNPPPRVGEDLRFLTHYKCT